MEVERVPCSPDRLLAEVISVLRVPAGEKGLALDYAWATALFRKPSSAIPPGCGSCSINLVGNAVKFTSKGSVHVVGRFVSEGAATAVGLRVIDTGIGIPAEKLGGDLRPLRPGRQFGDAAVRRHRAWAWRSAGGSSMPWAALSPSPARSEREALSRSLLTGAAAGRAGARCVARPTIRLAAPRKQAARTRGHASAARVLVVEDGDTNRKLIESGPAAGGAGGGHGRERANGRSRPPCGSPST